jgi:hypothetical protein
MIDYYFLDSMGNIDGSKVFLTRARETYYITNSKRWNGVGTDPAKCVNRFRVIKEFISSRRMPYKVSNDETIKLLYR